MYQSDYEESLATSFKRFDEVELVKKIDYANVTRTLRTRVSRVVYVLMR